MSDSDPEQGTARRKPVWPPPKRGVAALPPGPVISEPPVSFKIVDRGSAGLLDAQRWAKWENTLNGHELDQWRKLKAILLTAGPEFRAAAMNLIVDQQMDHARKGRSDADETGERFRRDIIDRNIPAYSQQVENLDSAFTAVVNGLDQMDRAREQVSDQMRSLDTALSAVQVQGMQIQKVSLPWAGTWPGAERGRGISDYDNTRGVEQVGKEVQAAAEKRSHKPIEPKAEEMTAPKSPGKPSGGLFGLPPK